jgi:hypothetical protein
MSKWRYEDQPGKVRDILQRRGIILNEGEQLITTARKFLIGVDNSGDVFEIDDLETALRCGYTSQEWERLEMLKTELESSVRRLRYDYSTNRFSIIEE